MSATQQLPLPFAHHPEFAAADLVASPGNEAARAWLARTEDWPEGRLALFGEAGAGKTHLLHLWAARRGALLCAGAALEAGAPPAAGLAIDEAESVPDAEAFLHLLNAARARRVPVLLAARTAPARWAVPLPDLASRLRATLAVPIGPADDALLAALLTRLAADRQLDIPEPVRMWLLRSLPRSPGVLREAVARLDRAALGRPRGITRALAAEVVAELEAG